MSNFNFGLRSLADTSLRFFGPGLVCYLRINNVTPAYNPAVNEVGKLGFQPTVTGNLSGFTDILIDPPPDVQEMSMKNIGINSARLRFGTKVFMISHTFVLKRMLDAGYSDPLQVFSDASVMGLFYDNRLYNFEQILHEDLAGQPIFWKIVSSGLDVTSPAAQKLLTPDVPQ